MTTDAINGTIAAPSKENEALFAALTRALSNGGATKISTALRNGTDSITLIKSMLEGVRMTPEQQSVLDLILAIPDEKEVTVEPVSPSEHNEDDLKERSNKIFEEREDVRSVRQELADLRQVNDTLAAALGACPFCWGGNSACRECNGRGRVGSGPPDVELFNELVAPAVKRMLATRRTGWSGVSRNRR